VDTIKISGVAGFDGSYEVDQDALNWGDLRFIQRESGVMGGELDEHLRRGNIELIVAFAKIALRRAGHPYADRFDEALDTVPISGDPPISYIMGDEEGEDAKTLDPPKSSDEPDG